MTDTARRVVTARKQYRCDVRDHYPRPCPGTIRPGERYVRLVAFPGHIANDGPAPWVMRECLACAANRGVEP
jgi:hypothetical protein